MNTAIQGNIFKLTYLISIHSSASSGTANNACTCVGTVSIEQDDDTVPCCFWWTRFLCSAQRWPPWPQRREPLFLRSLVGWNSWKLQAQRTLSNWPLWEKNTLILRVHMWACSLCLSTSNILVCSLWVCSMSGYAISESDSVMNEIWQRVCISWTVWQCLRQVWALTPGHWKPIPSLSQHFIFEVITLGHHILSSSSYF